LLAGLSACGLDRSIVHYCNGDSGDKLTMDFSAKVTSYTSAGVTDQLSPIEPCTDRIEACFLGEISFVNPFESAVPRHANFVSVERRGADAFAVATRGGGTRTSYSIQREERWPREIRISDLDGSSSGTFVRCWLPFGPSPWT
jgi:hypothetical protein